MLIFVTGGSGSGKSEYAEMLCMKCRDRQASLNRNNEMIYIATMEPFGEEGQKRIERHHALRAGKGFRTIERYTDLEGMLAEENVSGVVLLECLSNLVANEMFSPKGSGADILVDKTMHGIEMLAEKADDLIVVSNQIFSDGIVYDSGTMEYMEKLGALNARVTGQSDVALEVVAGIPIFLRGNDLISFL